MEYDQFDAICKLLEEISTKLDDVVLTILATATPPA